MAADEVSAGLVAVWLAIGDEAAAPGRGLLAGSAADGGGCYAGAGLPLSQTNRLML